MSRHDRVTFFSKRDMAGRAMLEQAKALLVLPQDFAAMDLNSLLEFHHIQQYFDQNMFPEGCTAEEKAAYQQTVKSALGATRAYLLNIVPGLLVAEADKLEFSNRENFWILLQYFEIYKKIDGKLFLEVLAGNSLNIRYVLPLKQLVQHYNTELRTFLLNDEESAELLLSHYEEQQTEPSAYVFPKSLTDADKHDIISAYLDSHKPNLNYVDLAKNSKHLKLPPKLLLKAKQTSGRITSEILTEENSMSIGVSATMDPKQTEPVIYQNDDKDTRVSYGKLFFDSIKSDAQLFSLFSGLFFYTDQEGLIDLINKNAEMDVLETIFMRSKNTYRTGMVFAKKDMLSRAQLAVLSLYLSDNGRSIEELIANTVSNLFTNHLKMEDLIFNMPDKNLGPAEKIRLLAPEIEYLLKQFKHFVTEGSIDHELLQIDSTPIYYSEIPSLMDKKYIFSNHENISTIQHYFFDENSILADRKDTDNRKILFETLKDGYAKKSDFEDYQIPALEQAIEIGDLVINDHGIIQMADPAKVIIAGKLRKNGFMSYWHFHPPFRAEIDRLINAGFLKTSSQLFTTDEISYLNFYLNKKEFSNGKDLRNKYLHGSNNRDVRIQELDYLHFLRTFILILLKISDDIALKNHYRVA